MTLQEMRDVLLKNLFDSGNDFLGTTALADRYINMAMQHVANVAASADGGLFIATWAGTVTNGSGLADILVNIRTAGTITDQTGTAVTIYTRPVRIVHAERTSYSSGNGALKVVRFDEIGASRRLAFANSGTGQELPPIYMTQVGWGFVEPKTGISVTVAFVHEVPFMVANTDTPGQVSGAGTADLLPIRYQPLIPTFATILVLAAENRDSTRFENIYAAQTQALGATLPWRKSVKEEVR